MTVLRTMASIALATATGCSGTADRGEPDQPAEVVFWHFWGGRDRPVVDDVIRRFNASQDEFCVRGVAMPGANLDLKVFLSLAGGDPPDLLNHDDPIVADWAHRGAITPLDQVASAEEVARLKDWLLPAAWQLGAVDGRPFALVNGLDVRALYYNVTLLEELGLSPPESLRDLDAIAAAVAPKRLDRRAGYLPDPRRLWAWGTVFDGDFEDPDAPTPEERVTLDDPAILDALKWMASYATRYGPDRIAAFRTGEQALTGASFPLLADRRYAIVMDGQWRVRDLAEAAAEAQRVGKPIDRYGVAPLPPPEGGRTDAGCVNGNFFVIPRGSDQPAGAWRFMQFWTGLDGAEEEAAETAAQGGWLPPSRAVIEEPRYQQLLEEQPLLREFVRLAASPEQRPTPLMPAAGFYYREVVAAAQDVMYRGADPSERLAIATERVRNAAANAWRPRAGGDSAPDNTATDNTAADNPATDNSAMGQRARR